MLKCAGSIAAYPEHFARSPIGSVGDNHISSAVRSGLGIAQRYRRTEEDAIINGSLIEILPEYEPSPVQFFVYYPSRQQQPAKLTAFLK